MRSGRWLAGWLV
jgi:hypothetical protein